MSFIINNHIAMMCGKKVFCGPAVGTAGICIDHRFSNLINGQIYLGVLSRKTVDSNKRTSLSCEPNDFVYRDVNLRRT